MNYLAPIFSILLIAGQLIFAEPSNDSHTEPDFIRFANNDTLHGKLISFGPDQSLTWGNPQTNEPINFSTNKLHRITLNRGKAHKKITSLSNVSLNNGDVIPGKIISSDDQVIILDTEHLGQSEIPLTKVSKISLSPFGGKNIYYGPLNGDGWNTIQALQRENSDKKKEKEAEEKPELTDWQHIGAAWYSGTDKSRFLLKKNAMSDKCRISFKLAWRGNLYSHIALHADFAPPQSEQAPNRQLEMAATVGQAYILNLSNYNATLTSCSFDEDGKPQNTRIQGSEQNLGLAGLEIANIDIRLDRTNKTILLFVNDNFKAKWSITDDYMGKGNHLAFKNLSQNKSHIRISELVISEWNGMADSASSMKSIDRDTILLNNGLDRFSGSFISIDEGKVTFNGSFNNTMTIPMEEVSEIQLATGKLTTETEEHSDNVYFYIYPHGRISGQPQTGEINQIQILNDLLGPVTLDARYMNIIDFSHTNSLLENWDDNF